MFTKLPSPRVDEVNKTIILRRLSYIKGSQDMCICADVESFVLKSNKKQNVRIILTGRIYFMTIIRQNSTDSVYERIVFGYEQNFRVLVNMRNSLKKSSTLIIYLTTESSRKVLYELSLDSNRAHLFILHKYAMQYSVLVQGNLIIPFCVDY